MRPTQHLNRYGLDIEAIEQDKLSSRLRTLWHKGQELPDMAALKKKADAFMDKVQYLEDELREVEQDNVRQAVVLRSVRPLEEKSTRSYYEVLVQQNGETRLQRLQYDARSGDTEPTDFVMTDRLLERLAGDLEALSEQ